MTTRRQLVTLAMTLLLGACGQAPAGGGGATNGGSAGGGAAASPGSDEVVVVVNGVSVTRGEYEQALFERFGVSYLEPFIEDRLVAQKAQEAGITVDEREVEASVQKDVDALLRTRFSGSEEALNAALAERGMTLEGWRKELAERARRDQRVAALLKKERSAESEAVKQRFEQKYGEDGVKVRVRHILVSTKVISSRFYPKEEYEAERPKLEAEVRTKANETLAALRGGGDFAALAKERSDDFTAARGGDLGEAWKGRFGKEFDEAVERLAVGAAPVLVTSRRGVHIIEVTSVERGVDFKGSAILVATAATGPEDKRTDAEREAAAQEKLKQVQAALKEGKPFGEVARELSDDLGTRVRGGDLGVFGRRRLGEEVDAALEAAPVPSVVGPVKTGRGYWLVDLKERTAAPTKDKKIVRHIFFSTEYDDVKKRKLEPRLEELAQAKAKDLLGKLQGGADFGALAEAESEDAYTRKTGGEYLNYRKASLGPEIWEAVQTMQPNGPAQIVQSKRGYHIVQLIERTRTELDAVKAEVLKELNEQPVGPAEQQAFLERLKEGATIERKIGPPPAPKLESPH